MSDNESYIDNKNEKKSDTKDISIGKFFTSILIGVAMIIVYFYFSSVNVLLSYKYAKTPMSGQNLLLVPYTPFNTMSEYAMSRGKESFKNFKRSGGLKMPSLSEIFPMDSWSFPYKNKFTEKQYERTHTENMEDFVFRIVTWFTETMAAVYSSGRFLLQMYFSMTDKTINVLDDGVKEDRKMGELLVFMLGTPLFLLSLMMLSPLYSSAATIAFSLFNIRYAIPPFLGWNFITWLYFVFLLPVILNIIFIVGGITLHSSINSFILPLIYFAFIMKPLFDKDMRKSISSMMFTKKRLATFLIMLVVITSASNHLGKSVGLYMSIAGIIFILLMAFNMIK
jgi:hypothetical protein